VSEITSGYFYNHGLLHNNRLTHVVLSGGESKCLLSSARLAVDACCDRVQVWKLAIQNSESRARLLFKKTRTCSDLVFICSNFADMLALER